MICADRSTFDDSDACRAAAAIRAAQVDLLRRALEKVIGRMAHRPKCVVLSGGGEFLAADVVGDTLPTAETVSLAAELGVEVSRAAPAHALAVVAREGQSELAGRPLESRSPDE
jgi:uncharacterized hydantoinase/oxoprolinase family protein